MTHPVDKQVGQNVKLYRLMANLSQEELGNAIGVTFQQVQKYEKGLNRIGCSRLYDIATKLQVNVSAFFIEYDPLYAKAKPHHKLAEEKANYQADALIYDKDTVALIKAYKEVSNKKLRKLTLSIVQALAGHL